MVVCCIALVAFITPVVFAHGDEDDDSNPYSATPEVEEQLSTCLSLSENRDTCYAPLCDEEPGYLCAEDLLGAAVKVAGPEKAMMALHDIMASPVFAITADGHLLSHIIGRSISHNFGSSGENFLRCPSDFNNGCFHGFFEDTLPNVESPVDATMRICESMPSTTPLKEKSYCYHGAGHVFMMNESHNLDAALALCLQLPDPWAESCWQGVFMENAGEREWELKKKNFRKDEPLYPCTVVEDKFKPECYINHHGYLIRHYSTSWDSLVEVCLGAGDFVEHCLGGLGLMLGSEYWIGVVAEDAGITEKRRTDKVTFLCNQFPDEYIQLCYTYAIPSFLNFGHGDLTDVSHICLNATDNHRRMCFERIGSYLSNLVSSEKEKAASCASVPEEYRNECLYPGRSMSDIPGNSDIVAESAIQQSENTSWFAQIGRFFSSIARHVVHMFTLSASAHSEDGTDEIDQYAHPEIQDAAERCSSLESDRDTCYTSLCQDDALFICAEDILRAVTVSGGPETGMQVLGEMVESPLFAFSPVNEGHSLAHIVGRMTAQHFGRTGDIFLRCPTSFDYGCQHGFLEDVLPKAASPAEAVTSICESLPEKPDIGKPNCYHGSGHGVLMNESYNLNAALLICDATPDPFSCWTGVFMENASGNNNGRIQEWYPENNTFRADNPLAPCDAISEKYHIACYRQHMPYLAHHFQYRVKDVVDACLSAGEHVPACVFGFGAYGIYDGIQNSFLPEFEGNLIDKIIHLCNQFPEKWRRTCYTPAIDQISIFYNPERTAEFCNKIDSQYMRYCFWVIGNRLKNLVVNDDEKIEACTPIPEKYRNECLYPEKSPFNAFGYKIGTTTSAAQLVIDEERQQGHTTGTIESTVQEPQNISWFTRVGQFFSGIVHRVVHMLTPSASAHSEDSDESGEKAADTSDYLHTDMSDGIRQCLLSEEGRGACFASLCDGEPGYLCAEDIIGTTVFVAGTQEAMTALHAMTWEGAFTFDASSAHLLAHIAGRETANQFGVTGEAFNMCPISFDYGCQHGFLEEGLTEGGSAVELIMQMCESLPDVPPYAKVACYHGSGHALVMNDSYDIHRSLSQCDMFPVEYRGGCWSGVFMENVNAIMANRIVVEEYNSFSDDDLFAPCSSVDERHKDMCYRQQMPYWVSYRNIDLQGLLDLCAKIESGHKDACISSVGAYSIYTGFQDTLLGSDFEGSFIDKTIHICNQFPEEYREICYEPAIDQNFIYYGAEVISEFCEKIDEEYRKRCWWIVGRRIDGTIANESERTESCAPVPEKYKEVCLSPHSHNTEDTHTAQEEQPKPFSTSSTERTKRFITTVFESARTSSISFVKKTKAFIFFLLHPSFIFAHDGDECGNSNSDSVMTREALDTYLSLSEERDVCPDYFMRFRGGGAEFYGK